MRIVVRAKPGSRRPGIRLAGDEIVVTVRERAVDGIANAAVLRSLAAWLGVPPSSVVLVGGAGSRSKVVRVDGLSDAAFAAARDRLPP